MREPTGFLFEPDPSPWVNVWFPYGGPHVEALKEAAGPRMRRYDDTTYTWFVHKDKWPAVLTALRYFGFFKDAKFDHATTSGAGAGEATQPRQGPRRATFDTGAQAAGDAPPKNTTYGDTLWLLQSENAKLKAENAKLVQQNLALRMSGELRGFTNQFFGKSDSGPWSVLFLLPEAPPTVIQAAYRRLAALYHPDTGGATASVEKMKALNQAYETLMKQQR